MRHFGRWPIIEELRPVINTHVLPVFKIGLVIGVIEVVHCGPWLPGLPNASPNQMRVLNVTSAM